MNVGQCQGGDRFGSQGIEPVGRLVQVTADGDGPLQDRQGFEALARPAAVANAAGLTDERFGLPESGVALGRPGFVLSRLGCGAGPSLTHGVQTRFDSQDGRDGAAGQQEDERRRQGGCQGGFPPAPPPQPFPETDGAGQDGLPAGTGPGRRPAPPRCA